jgi:hypothetical protein
MKYTEQDNNHLANTSFIIGYYESMLKSTLKEIQEGNTDYVNVSIPRLIEKTLKIGSAVWEQRYDKHWVDILKEAE